MVKTSKACCSASASDLLALWMAGGCSVEQEKCCCTQRRRPPSCGDFLLTPELYNLVTYGHRSTPMETPDFYTNIARKGMFSRSAPKKWALYVSTHGIFFWCFWGGCLFLDACKLGGVLGEEFFCLMNEFRFGHHLELQHFTWLRGAYPQFQLPLDSPHYKGGSLWLVPYKSCKQILTCRYKSDRRPQIFKEKTGPIYWNLLSSDLSFFLCLDSDCL